MHDRDRRLLGGRRSFREGRRRPHIVRDLQPDGRRVGSGPVGEHPGHPFQHVLGRVRLTDPAREVRQDLVRGRTLAVHKAVGELASTVPRRREEDRQGRRGRERSDR